MASRQPSPGVEETPGGRSLPEPTAYANAVGRAEPSAAPPSRHRSPEDPPPRTPAMYAHTDHFRQRLHQQGRYVSVPIVAEAINHGQLRWNTTDGWRFALVRHGIRYVVVVSDTETQSPVIVTGWTAIDDPAMSIGPSRSAATVSSPRPARDRWSVSTVAAGFGRKPNFNADTATGRLSSILRPSTVGHNGFVAR